MSFFRVSENSVTCNFPESNTALKDCLSEKGFTFAEASGIISVKTMELLSSTGVKKSLGMKFPGGETWSFAELLRFQIVEIADYLTENRYAVSGERLLEMDSRLSVVTYNSDYDICGLLLASVLEDAILVEFLMGALAKSPQFILSSCQKFAENLVKMNMATEYPVIRMLTLNDGVIPLLRRLLDKEYSLKQEGTVLRGEKMVSTEEEACEFREEDYPEELLKGELQKNINEKYDWKDGKKKG